MIAFFPSRPVAARWRACVLTCLLVVGIGPAPSHAQTIPVDKSTLQPAKTAVPVAETGSVKADKSKKSTVAAKPAKEKAPIAAKKQASTNSRVTAASSGPTVTRAYPPAEKRTAPANLLRSGPMVTYSTMREVGLWVQLAQAGGAQIEYWEKGKPQRRWRTAVVLTTGPDHLAELVADSVQPGHKYSYRLWAATVDEVRLRVLLRPYPLEFQSQALWQWRDDPPAFRVALGSCNYVADSAYDRPGPSYGGGYNIFTAIDQNKPDLMVWLGDNTYLREADWDSPTGIRRRYAHTRALPALQPLLGSVHHYATWDDHDFGPNDGDRSFALRDATLRTFKSYWPSLGAGQGGGGVASTFTWNDTQFFLLDDRWHRTPNRDDAAHGQFFGPEQLQWLTEGLVSSRATFKIVCVGGQVLNPAKVFENYANYETERTELLRRLAETRVPGVVFVTGDRHHAELTRLDRPGLYPLYDLTTSPLTAGPAAGGRREANPLRDTSTFRAERNFALLDVAGPEKDRTLTLTLCDIDGRPLWKRTLRAADLKPGATPPAAPVAADTAPPPAPGDAPIVAPATPATESPRARRAERRRARGPRAIIRATTAPPTVRVARPVTKPVVTARTATKSTSGTSKKSGSPLAAAPRPQLAMALASSAASVRHSAALRAAAPAPVATPRPAAVPVVDLQPAQLQTPPPNDSARTTTRLPLR